MRNSLPTSGEVIQRPVIHRIILHNFKSYYGTQVLGPFDNHFTSIVGANGNGKSNSIDAIQFVFGKRGKQMRANKVRELVWQASKELEARVEIIFRFVLQDDASAERYEEDQNGEIKELKIARIIPVGVNSTSKYQINDKTTTFAGVQDALRSLSIEPMNDRFLILQGEVEAISQMKPLDLLDYLNNIIGTTEFMEPIEDAKKRLEQSSQDRDLQYDRLRHNEAILDALEGPVTEAQTITRMKIQKNEIVYQQRLLYHNQAKNNIQLCKNHINEVRATKDNLRKLLLDRQKDNRDSEIQYINVRKQYDALVSAMESCKANLHRYENERVHLTKEIKNASNKLAKISKEKGENEESYKNRIKSCEERHESLTKECKAVDHHLNMARTSLENLTNAYEEQLQPIIKEIEEVQQKALPFYNEINILENELKIKKSLREKGFDHQKDLEQLEEKQKRIEKEYNTVKEEYESNSKLLEETSSLLSEKRAKREEVLYKISKMESLKRSSELELSELEQTAEQFRSFNLVYDTLMECKQSGTISGICDKLANCGDVDEKYQKALFAACQHLNYIVTDDMGSASTCVRYLQKNKVGIGRFIMLDRIDHLKKKMYKKLDSIPKGSKRLFDMIQFKDEKYKTAFYFALKDTLVARNIHEARKIAFGGEDRYRVVTLNGELIETTGTMSSGSNLEQVMLMTTISATLNNKRMALQPIVEEYENLLGIRSNIGRELSHLENELRNIKFENEKLSFRLTKIETTRKNELENSKHLALEYSQNLEDIELEIQQIEEKIMHKKEQSSTFEVTLEKLRNKQSEVGGISMHEHRNKIDLLEKQMEEIKSKIAQNSVKKMQLEKQMANAIENAKKVSEQKESYEKNVQSLREKLSELLENGESLQSDFSKAEEDKNEMERKLRALDDAQEEFQSNLCTLKVQETELTTDEKNLIQKLHEYEKQQSYWRKELNKSLRSLVKDWKIIKVFELNVPSQSENTQMQNVDETDAMQDVEESDEMQDIDHAHNDNVHDDTDDFKKIPELKQFIENIHSLREDQFNEEELSTTLQTIEASLYQYNDRTNRIRSLVEDYQGKKAIYLEQHATFTKLSEERQRIQLEFDSLRKQRLEKFMKGFMEITFKLKEIYQMITMGGDAELELVDRHDPFKAGIIFSVKPPRKSWRKIQNLSGGEKTLSSLALIFALHHFKPTPLYIMDEIDAALDYRNVAIVGHYIKQRTKNAQFIVISLRNSMFELADRLVGIFKVENKTRSVTVQPKCIIDQANRRMDTNDSTLPSKGIVTTPRRALNPIELNTA